MNKSKKRNMCALSQKRFTAMADKAIDRVRERFCTSTPASNFFRKITYVEVV